MMAKPRSQLFTLRVWGEDVGNGRIEFRGTLKHITTGETIHFRNWNTLIQHLETTWEQKKQDKSIQSFSC
jgi:hypothetical protein